MHSSDMFTITPMNQQITLEVGEVYEGSITIINSTNATKDFSYRVSLVPDYSAFIMFGTFLGISKSYSESAELDGASELQILLNVILPQIVPLIIALMVTSRQTIFVTGRCIACLGKTLTKTLTRTLMKTLMKTMAAKKRMTISKPC